MTPPTFRFSTRLRVRWAEVDAQKIVFNGHYLTYFDTATSDYYRAVGIPYPGAFARLSGDLFVKKSTIEYHAPARYDDVLDICIRCAGIGNTSLTLAWAIVRSGTTLVTGEAVYVFAETSSRAKHPVPAVLRAALTAYDAGEETVVVRAGTYEEARALRHEVFVMERGVPEADEWDALDAGAVHVVAHGPLGEVLATGRLTQPSPGVGRVGRMAVLHAMRGAGLGRRVLAALVDAAAARGDRELILHAMLDVEPFYAASGFVAVGEPFVEAGIPHRAMKRALSAASTRGRDV